MKKVLPALLLLGAAIFTGAGVLYTIHKQNKSVQNESSSESAQLTPLSPEALTAETNKLRQKPLALDPVLNNTAQSKCEDMARRNDYSHGDVRSYRLKANRLNFSENIALDYTSTEEVVKAWADSPSHLGAMTDIQYNRVGFGICPFGNTTLVVQHFSDSLPASEPAVKGTSTQSGSSSRNFNYRPNNSHQQYEDTMDNWEYQTSDYSKPSSSSNSHMAPPSSYQRKNYGSSGACDSSAAQYIPECN
jgi:hypothetical protein